MATGGNAYPRKENQKGNALEYVHRWNTYLLQCYNLQCNSGIFFCQVQGHEVECSEFFKFADITDSNVT